MVVTRDDVARAAGVSSAVVSYVLNDGPRPVSAAARQRVLDAIEQLGYRRNSIARSMRTQTTESIGFVLPDIAMAYFATMTQRITEMARQRGLGVIVATSNGSTEIEREHLKDLAERRVDGVILMSVDPLQELIWAGELGMPVLVVDRPAVASAGTAAATTHLLTHGRRRLSRLAGPAEQSITIRRAVGWHGALTDAGIDEATTTVVHAPLTESAGYDSARSLLTARERPDAVVVDSPSHALALLRAAADLGIDVPGDVAVVACEIGSAAEYLVPRLTSVDSPLDQVAERAVDAIAAASPDDRLLSLDGTEFELHVRESCGSHPHP